MANQSSQIFPRFLDKRNASRTGTKVNALTEKANIVDLASLDARLTALNGTLYSAARLEKLTTNDKIFALRTISDSAGIK